MRIANPGGVSRAALGRILTRVLVNVSANALAAILMTLPLRQARPRRAMAALGKTITLLAVCIGISVAFGEEKTSSIGLVSLHIPEQPLIDALHLYSRQTGVQVMFETASALGYRSKAVEGELSPEAALRTLLADTDLKIRYSRSSAVTLAPASVPDPDEPPGALLPSADMALDTLHVSGGAADAADHSRLGDYIGAVQSDIQKALKSISRNRRGDYRVAVKLWVASSSRIIERAELDGSTGDRDRDSTIADALRGMTLSQQSPPNMPRPIRFMISIHAL
jgi:hypothetical protein